MKLKTKALSVITACALVVSASVGIKPSVSFAEPSSKDISNTMEWGSVEIGGGGFVTGIITGQKEMYLRTDVGGAYKYNYETNRWDQLFAFINEADRGLLSVKGIAIDPTDDDTVYFLCGCAYFSDARTEIIKTTDGGKTFTRVDVTDMIQVHGNGDGRECSEPIAIDPDDPDIIYAGGDVTAGDSALIKSTDGGKTWKPVKGYDDLGLYKNDVKWPTWTDHIARGTGSGEYNTQNGVATIKVLDGKVYVGTSVTGQTNIHVADVDTDEFTELSSDLPTANYPVTISDDGNGNIFVTYIAGLAFGGSAGGAYKYNIASGKVTDISPSGNAIGMITADKSDPNKLLARTCGLWSDQWYEEEWTETSIAWGDHFFRSTDGGENWTDITPGQQEGQYTDNHYFVSEPIDTNGYAWIYGKAVHWGSGILIDPRNSDKILMTSGNGVFACDNVWDEKGLQFYFDPAGIEEVVALDMVSIPERNAYSAIGDYDGFIHTDVNEIPEQYQPNMGSTSAIAYCPQNPDVMIRIAKDQNDTAPGFYTLDGGKTWNKMANANGGRAAITQLEDGSYRFFKSAHENDKTSAVFYSDDLGQTWETCTGIPSAYGSKMTNMFIEPNKPNIVYAYVTYYNESWFYSKDKPDMSDAHYTLCVSTDYGKTFTGIDVAMYDQCDSAGRIAYLGEDNLIIGAGWYGMYSVTDNGKTINKLENVSYCKTVGYGAPEKKGDVNTLYMYGKPQDSDPEGVYRSQDGGETWVLINSEMLYGGTGNGNFLVGDMNEFGTVYMSTVGCGIIYGRLSEEPIPPETSETSETTIPTTTTTTVTTEETGNTIPSGSFDPKDLMYGDTNRDMSVDSADIVVLNKYLINSVDYPLKDAQAYEQAQTVYDDEIDTKDSIAIINCVLQLIDLDDLGPAR